jgi:hypothetical protein
MNQPTCPRCGATPRAAFVQPRFTRSTCRSRLSSNLRVVSLVECLVGIGPLVLVAAALLKIDALRQWSFTPVLLLLLVPACVVHCVVLGRYLKLVEQTTTR